MIIAENDIGYLVFDGNELTIGSKVDDPPKLRLTCPNTEHGGGGGVISFNFSRQAGVVCDGHAQNEISMIRAEQAEDVRGDVGNTKAELNFMVDDGRNNGQDSMRKPLAFTCDGYTHDTLGDRPIIEPLEPVNVHPSAMWSPRGRFVTQQQDDGNFVTYDTGVNPWKAVWSAWTGKL